MLRIQSRPLRIKVREAATTLTKRGKSLLGLRGMEQRVDGGRPRSNIDLTNKGRDRLPVSH
jgi:hypothetical protein